MAFFQNLFSQEFRGSWVLSDRQYSLTFVCPANQNTSRYQLAYNNSPWNFSESGTLTLNYALENDSKNYHTMSIDLTGENPGNTTAMEVVEKLNNNDNFSLILKAELKNSSILITSKNDRINNLWISNEGAEKQMKFNKKAGVAELPSYFERHTIENINNYKDSTGQLLLLNKSNPIDLEIIESAGFDANEEKKDWELMEGRVSGLFTFQKLSVDVNNRITQIIEYPSGAKTGNLARKINYTYSSSESTTPTEVTEVPYVLKNDDLVSP